MSHVHSFNVALDVEKIRILNVNNIVFWEAIIYVYMFLHGRRNIPLIHKNNNKKSFKYRVCQKKERHFKHTYKI